MGIACSASGVATAWLVEAPVGKSPLGRLRRKWEPNTNVDGKELGCGCVPFINSIECR